MFKAIQYMRARHWGIFGLSMVFVFFQVYLDLKIPDYMATITTLVKTPGSPMAQIWISGGMMLLCALGSLVAAIATGLLSARLAASFSMDLRVRVFDRVQSFSM